MFSCSVVSDSLQPYGLQHARLPSPSPSLGACSNSWLLSWPSNHLVFCCPLLLLPLVFPSIRVFSNESTLHIRWPKYWSFSISPSSEYSGLISFRIDWFDLLAVQGPLKSLLQHHISKASVLQYHGIFTISCLRMVKKQVLKFVLPLNWENQRTGLPYGLRNPWPLRNYLMWCICPIQHNIWNIFQVTNQLLSITLALETNECFLPLWRFYF